MGFEQIQSFGRDVFEFIGDDIDGLGKCFERVCIVIGSSRHAIRDLTGGWIGARLVDMCHKTEPRGRDRQHPAQLTATQNPNSRPRSEHVSHQFVSNRFPIAAKAARSASCALSVYKACVICRLSVPSVANASRSSAKRPACPICMVCRNPDSN